MGNFPTAHVANAYHEDIKVRVDNIKENQLDYERLIKASGGIGISGGVDGAKGKVKKDSEIDKTAKIDKFVMERNEGFTTIRSGDYLSFGVIGDQGLVYVSIKTKTKWIANDYPLRNNHNILVDECGYMQMTRKDRIWIDKNGNKHSFNPSILHGWKKRN